MNRYSVAILIKSGAFSSFELQRNYMEPLQKLGLAQQDVIAFSLSYNDSNKAPAKHIKDYLSKLLPALDSLDTKFLYVADSNYFKVLAGQSKADPHFGYALPCKVKGFEHMTVVLGLNHNALIYDPSLEAKLTMSLETVASAVQGTYTPPGAGIIHSASYPRSLDEIAAALDSLHQYPELSADIEAFSLRFDKAGIGTIAFCWDAHNGIAFPCDYQEHHEEHPDFLIDAGAEKETGLYGYQLPNLPVRALIKSFLETYKGRLTWHKADYDVKVIVYTLWMKNGLDTQGLLEGLEVMAKSFHDTKIIAYLATNSTAGNTLGLKPLAHEFAGNWAVEVKDIRKVPLETLLTYNLVDGLCTNYVKDKYLPIMQADKQEDLYENLMLPSLRLILQMELTGMPLIPGRVAAVRAELESIRDKQLQVFAQSPLVDQLNQMLRESEWEKDYLDRKNKAKNPDKILPKAKSAFDSTVFNPNSGPQLQRLFYELMQLPVLEFTDTKMPATGADTIEKLINHATDASHKELLGALIANSGVNKILNTFIPAFEESLDKGDGVWWLHGSFNIGGTVSGRLSSSDPNLQNIPANVELKVDGEKVHLGKLIKSCFAAPKGWLFAGADFNSLEDYISALTTKDPNKLKVYTDGFDGHCLRAAYYFADQCPDIDPTDPKSVNSMKEKYPKLRQESKGPTFLLTYGGTYHGMMSNLGWPEDKAKAIEAGYHTMYQVSDQYVASRLNQAAKDGYVEVAFGLRVRTPLLSQVIWGGPRVPFEAQAEGRTAGNALGQSYGLLNNRAAVEFFQKVWASKYRYDIKPVALIHDAIYVLIKDDIEVVEWANRELIKSMQWQDLPEIQHPTVKLGAALDIFWPSWAKATTLPNNADQQTIVNLCKATKAELTTRK